jgi:hypothetical protein
MNPRFPHIENESQMLDLLDADRMAIGQSVFAVVGNLRKTADAEFRRDPKESQVAREDWRYKLAVVETLDKVLALPAQARTMQEEAAKQRSGS